MDIKAVFKLIIVRNNWLNPRLQLVHRQYCVNGSDEMLNLGMSLITYLLLFKILATIWSFIFNLQFVVDANFLLKLSYKDKVSFAIQEKFLMLSCIEVYCIFLVYY